VDNVLGSARTGLIFTGIQEGTQPGGLTHLAKQSKVFHTVCRHAGFPWGGAARQELTRDSGVGGGGCGGRLSGLCGLCWIFSLSVSLLFLSPLFAVLLNCPYPDPPVFCLFLSILLHTPAGGGAASWRFCCRLQLKPEQKAKEFNIGSKIKLCYDGNNKNYQRKKGIAVVNEHI